MAAVELEWIRLTVLARGSPSPPQQRWTAVQVCGQPGTSRGGGGSVVVGEPGWTLPAPVRSWSCLVHYGTPCLPAHSFRLVIVGRLIIGELSWGHRSLFSKPTTTSHWARPGRTANKSKHPISLSPFPASPAGLSSPPPLSFPPPSPPCVFVVVQVVPSPRSAARTPTPPRARLEASSHGPVT